MTRVVVMTGSTRGMSGVGLAALVDSGVVDVVALIISMGKILNRRRFLVRKLRKFLFSVGPTGMISGLRVRRILNVKDYACDLPDAVSVAEAHRIPIYTVDSLNTTEAEQLLVRLAPELGISLGNGLIRPSFYSIPRRGSINVHHGAIPRYRGGPPVFWEIYNGDDSVGFTIHKLDAHTDTGDVLAAGSVPIQYARSLVDTMRSTMRSLYTASASALVDTVINIQTLELSARKQERAGFNTTPTLWQLVAASRRCRAAARARSSPKAAA